MRLTTHRREAINLHVPLDDPQTEGVQVSHSQTESLQFSHPGSRPTDGNAALRENRRSAKIALLQSVTHLTGQPNPSHSVCESCRVLPIRPLARYVQWDVGAFVRVCPPTMGCRFARLNLSSGPCRNCRGDFVVSGGGGRTIAHCGPEPLFNTAPLRCPVQLHKARLPSSACNTLARNPS